MENQILFQAPLIPITHQSGQTNTHPETTATLTANTLTWVKNGINQVLSLDDVVGASDLGETVGINHNINHPYWFVIHAYPVGEKRWGFFFRQRTRVLQEYHFACTDQTAVQTWITAIRNTLQGLPPNAPPQPPRRLGVILNPASGKKKAREIFNQVRPLLVQSHCQLTITETTGRNDGDLGDRGLDIAAIDALVVVGGDGTIHEVINRLANDADKLAIQKIPLGVIPGGTGNGLCQSLLAISGESYSPINAAFLIAKGRVKALDIGLVEEANRRYYSFLALSWGLVSDVDIESDVLRFLGALKNDVYALIRLIFLRIYPGKLSFVLHDSDEPDKWQMIEGDFILFWAMNVPWATYNLQPAPKACLDDGAIDLIIIRRGSSKLQLLQAFWQAADGSHLSLPNVEYYKVQRFRLEPLNNQGILAVDGERVDCQPIEFVMSRGIARVFC
ncbi:MAG TPA: hypothetical protein IGS52_08910 [Oscillatoriaceae cyanobacterium M33_DOE_052]|uniref:DAGKc domain-containing protein n=1 Tax=Planktothricoides sp. SpSt-374 TaxID=2282167 RepID=A0A7C3VFS8_9CYAN|nr:hypothetical protein [Oscillatoriaceae cyanobacterium M33_DOE_052]